MANKKLSQLTSAVTVSETDEIEVLQSGVNKRALVSQVGGSKKRTLTYIIDGGGSALPTGLSGFLARTPISGTITGWTLVADQSGSVVIDIWKASAVVPTIANTITASAKPSLSSQQIRGTSTLTGWTTSVSVNDVFGFKVDSVTTITKLTIALEITES